MEEVVVLDFGSDTFKAGPVDNFPNEATPRIVTPAAVQITSGALGGTEVSDPTEAVGSAKEAAQVVQTGQIAHWEGFEALISNILYGQLGWERGAEGRLLLSEPLHFSKADRERLTQLAFEEFNVDGLFLCDAPVLALYAVGKVTGCVVDIGHEKTDVAVVLEGQVSSQSVQEEPSAGPQSEANGDAVDMTTTHTLPDGQTITLAGGEGRRLGEAILDPGLAGLPGLPIADAIWSACCCHLDSPTRKAAMESLMLCGGGSLVGGMSGRLLREVRARSPASAAPQMLPLPDYMPALTLRYANWMGGAVLSKVVFSQNQQMTKYDYDEAGPMAVHRKCG
ncbi:hypothetical protein WJX73_007756 [Symbiochloris irregularis]|uniref:Actin n=1 Tax=Symbiochloris irregularis TaxID=706552 RepID=A0AAW1PAK7_9CHLO